MMTINFSKTRIFVFSFIILALILAGFKSGLFVSEEPIYVALVHSGPQKDWGGSVEVSRGVQMYIDSVNKMGGVNGKSVKLLIENDEANPDKAKKIASNIVKQTKALVVLGHVYSTVCIPAGEIYQQKEMPAISPSCMNDGVTKGNKWYFRTVSSAIFNGAFVANYVKKALEKDNVSIIYQDDKMYYSSIAESFQNSLRGIGGVIKHEEIIQQDEHDIDKRIEEITQTFLRDKPSFILLSADSNISEKIIVSMKRNELTTPIFAIDTILGTQFDKYFEEQLTPGFFSDGIYTNSYLISDVAGEGVQKIRSEYIKKYHEKPSWVVASSYEAAKIAIEAILETGVQGNLENLFEERQKIRNYLASRTSMKNNLAGIDSDFFFDKDGSAVKPLTIGVFQNRQLVSALTQFLPVSDLTQVANLEQELAKGRIVLVNGQYMYKTDIVYTGIDFNKISNIDNRNSTYELDFYLWFRSRRGVDASNVEFINSVRHKFSELKLSETPLVEKDLNLLQTDVTYKAYRVKADFKEKFDFRDYPFDQQKLAVRFSHANLTRNNLIYVIDLLGMGTVNEEVLRTKLITNKVFSTISDWKIKRASLFQDIITNESTLGDPILQGSDSHFKYSRFNAVIEIKREILSFVTKNLLPLLFLIGISYAIMFLPFAEISVTAISGILVAVAFFHLSLVNGLPSGIGYAVALDYAFYVIYALIVFQFIVIVIGQSIKKNLVALQRLLLIGKLVYPMVFVIVGALTVYLYTDLKTSFQSPSTIIADSNQIRTDATDATDTIDKVVLTFGVWRSVEVKKEMNQILAHFTKEYPNIEVRFQPAAVINYTSMLQHQLEKGLAPDVFQLKPFSESIHLFEAGHLEILDFPSLTENFDSQMLAPWMSDDDGEIYGVPYNAVFQGIYYNVNIFENEKLNLKVPTTWKELIVVAQTLKNAGYTPFANGLKTGWTTSEFIFMGIAPNFIGGREGREKYDEGLRCFNDKHVVATFKAIEEIAPFLPEKATEVGYEESKQLFLQGEAAMFMGTSWSISEFEQKQPDHLKWNVFAIPAPAGQPKYITYQPNFAIGLNATSKHKEEAKLFLTWLAKPETGKLFNQKIPGFFPMHKKVSFDNKHAQDFLAISDGLGTDVRWAFPKLMDAIPNGNDLMQKATEAVIKGEKTPQEAADILQYGLAQWFKPAQKCLINK